MPHIPGQPYNPEETIIAGYNTIWYVDDPVSGETGVSLALVGGDTQDPCDPPTIFTWDSIGHLTNVKSKDKTWNVFAQPANKEGVIVRVARQPLKTFLIDQGASSSVSSSSSSQSSCILYEESSDTLIQQDRPCPHSLCGQLVCPMSHFADEGEQVLLYFDGVGHLDEVRVCGRKIWKAAAPGLHGPNREGVVVLLDKVPDVSSSSLPESSSSSSCSSDKSTECDGHSVAKILCFWDGCGHLRRIQQRDVVGVNCGIFTKCCPVGQKLPPRLLLTMQDLIHRDRQICVVLKWNGCSYEGMFTTECDFFATGVPVIYHTKVSIYCRKVGSVGMPPVDICEFYICFHDEDHTATGVLNRVGETCCPLLLLMPPFGMQMDPDGKPFPRMCIDSASPGLDCYAPATGFDGYITAVPCHIPCDSFLGCLENA